MAVVVIVINIIILIDCIDAPGSVSFIKFNCKQALSVADPARETRVLLDVEIRKLTTMEFMLS